MALLLLTNSKATCFGHLLIYDGKKLKVDDSFPDVQLLPLQLDTNQLIKKVKDVCAMGNTLFLLDEMTATVHSFDRKDGRSLRSVYKRGNGPNEYANPVVLLVNSSNLYVLDMPTSRMVVFDKEWNAIGSIALRFPAFDFITFDTGFYYITWLRRKRKVGLFISIVKENM